MSEVDISIIQRISIVSHWSQWPPEEQGQQVRERREAVKDFSSHTVPLCKAPGSLWLLAPFIHTWICSAIFGYCSYVLDETSEDKLLTYLVVGWMNPWGNEWGFCFQSHVSAFWPHPGYFCLLYCSCIHQKRDWRPPWLMHNEKRNKDELFRIEGDIHQTMEIKNSSSPK